jgi:CHAT domain-containing protein
MAGVETVISTLWPVDDHSTAELMKHGLFDSTATYPETLQKVCLARIRELRLSGASANPFLWAAFVSAGNWRK